MAVTLSVQNPQMLGDISNPTSPQHVLLCEATQRDNRMRWSESGALGCLGGDGAHLGLRKEALHPVGCSAGRRAGGGVPPRDSPGEQGPERAPPSALAPLGAPAGECRPPLPSQLWGSGDSPGSCGSEGLGFIYHGDWRLR